MEKINDVNLYNTPIGGYLVTLQLNAEARSEMYLQISKFLENGVSEIAAAKLAAQEYKKYKSLRFFGYIFDKIYTNSEYHKTPLSDTLRPYIPQEEYFILKSCENTSVKIKIDAYEAASEICLSKKELFSEVKSAAFKTGLLLTALMGVIATVSLKLVPAIAESVDQKSWAPSFSAIATFSDFMVSYWYIPLTVVIAITALLVATIPKEGGELREKLDSIFPWNVYKTIASTGFLQSLVALKSANTSFSAAISSLSNNSKGYISPFLRRMLESKELGVSDGHALMNSGFFSPKTSADFAIYSEAGALDDSLPSIAKSTLENAVSHVKKVLGRIDLVVMLSIVGFIFLLLTAIFNTVSNIT